VRKYETIRSIKKVRAVGQAEPERAWSRRGRGARVQNRIVHGDRGRVLPSMNIIGWIRKILISPPI